MNDPILPVSLTGIKSAKTTEDIFFAVLSPYLKRTVILTKETWFRKIVPGHPEVSNRIELVKKVLTQDDKDLEKYKDRRNPDKMAILKECPHLRPLNKYIKVAVELINSNRAVVTTVQGINNLLDLYMEEIK